MTREDLEKLIKIDENAYREFTENYHNRLLKRCLNFYEDIDFSELESWVKNTFEVDFKLVTKYDEEQKSVRFKGEPINPSGIPLLSYMVKEIWFTGYGEIKQKGVDDIDFDFSIDNPLVLSISINLRYTDFGGGENGAGGAYAKYTKEKGWEFETVKDYYEKR